METINEKVVYTGVTHVTGGREGSAQSNDGRLDIKMSKPGSTGSGTNPEQLLAAGWSACFLGAIEKTAIDAGTRLPKDAAVDAEVDLGIGAAGYFLQARLNISLPGVERQAAQSWIDAAQLICPYSKALHGNIKIEYKLN